MPSNIVMRVFRGRTRYGYDGEKKQEKPLVGRGGLLSKIAHRLAPRKGVSARQKRSQGLHEPRVSLTEVWLQPELLELREGDVPTTRLTLTPMYHHLLQQCSCKATSVVAMPAEAEVSEEVTTELSGAQMSDCVWRPDDRDTPPSPLLQPPDGINSEGDLSCCDCDSIGNSYISDCVLRVRMTTTSDSHSNNNHNFYLRRYRLGHQRQLELETSSNSHRGESPRVSVGGSGSYIRRRRTRKAWPTSETGFTMAHFD